jgi:threonine/homoserine/homoserine lactone efflux protein
VLPGPDTLVFVRSLVIAGRKRAIGTAAGGLTGLVVWVGVAALGLSAVLRASHDAYLALRIAGAVYLIWLGWQSLAHRSSRKNAPALGDAESDAHTAQASGGARSRRTMLGSGYFAGLATNLLNPKVGVFFVTFLPGFVPAGYAIGPASLLLGAIYIAETVLYYAVLLRVSASLVGWMTTDRIRRRLDRVMGTVLIAFGVRLAVES